MAQPIPTTFDVLMLNIQQRLVSVLGFPPERILLDLDEDAKERSPAIQADQYVRVLDGGGDSDREPQDARGRVAPVVKETLIVALFTRLAVDDVNTKLQWLTDPANGNLRTRDSLWDALFCFQPMDTAGNWLVVEPLKVKNVRRPQDLGPKRPGWGRSGIEVEVKYQVLVNQAYQ
jgi:hypothetical protein